MLMSTSDLIKMAIRNLWKRKLRTFLTVLGVVIGTTSIVVMVSIGIGMNEGFQKQIEEWGSLQTITVSANANSYGDGGMAVAENSNGGSGGSAKKTELNLAAIETIRQMEGVEAATPVVNSYMRIGYGKLIAEGQVVGIDPASMEAMGYKITKGRALTAGDTKTMILGGTVVENFYNPRLSWSMREQAEKPEIEILGETVQLTYDWGYGTKNADKKIKPIKMKVEGLLSGSGSDGYSMFMPIKELEKLLTAQKKYEASQNTGGGGSNSNNNGKKKGVYEQALVKVATMEQVKEIQEQIKEMGFGAYSLTDQLDAMKETTKMLRFMLGAIGAVSLVVAAIGITNTMVMAIYERTREIGVMKVIGASLADIKKLFLTEAAFIGFAGGAVGVVLSLGASKLVNMVAAKQASQMMSSIPWWLCLATLGFATFIGVASGYFPARRAMGLSALSAIKTE